MRRAWAVKRTSKIQPYRIVRYKQKPNITCDSEQYHTTTFRLSVSLSLVVCVSVLSVCSLVSCGFVGLDGVEVVAVGGRSRVAGAWLRCVCVCVCVCLGLGLGLVCCVVLSFVWCGVVWCGVVLCV